MFADSVVVSAAPLVCTSDQHIVVARLMSATAVLNNFGDQVTNSDRGSDHQRTARFLRVVMMADLAKEAMLSGLHDQHGLTIALVPRV